MFDGTTVKLGEQNYVLPPLSLKQVKSLKGDIEGLSTENNLDEHSLDTVVKIVHAALSRNYPSLSVGQLEEWIDLGNVQTLVQIILGQSGFKSGEATRGEISTGIPSMH